MINFRPVPRSLETTGARAGYSDGKHGIVGELRISASA